MIVSSTATKLKCSLKPFASAGNSGSNPAYFYQERRAKGDFHWWMPQMEYTNSPFRFSRIVSWCRYADLCLVYLATTNANAFTDNDSLKPGPSTSIVALNMPLITYCGRDYYQRLFRGKWSRRLASFNSGYKRHVPQMEILLESSIFSVRWFTGTLNLELPTHPTWQWHLFPANSDYLRSPVFDSHDKFHAGTDAGPQSVKFTRESRNSSTSSASSSNLEHHGHEWAGLIRTFDKSVGARLTCNSIKTTSLINRNFAARRVDLSWTWVIYFVYFHSSIAVHVFGYYADCQVREPRAHITSKFNDYPAMQTAMRNEHTSIVGHKLRSLAPLRVGSLRSLVSLGSLRNGSLRSPSLLPRSTSLTPVTTPSVTQGIQLAGGCAPRPPPALC